MTTLADVISKAPKNFGASIEVKTADGPVAIDFTYRYRSRSELVAWLKSIGERDLSQADVVMEAAEGWGLSDKFTKKAVEQLLDVYHSAYEDFMEAYRRGLFQERSKN